MHIGCAVDVSQIRSPEEAMEVGGKNNNADKVIVHVNCNVPEAKVLTKNDNLVGSCPAQIVITCYSEGGYKCWSPYGEMTHGYSQNYPEPGLFFVGKIVADGYQTKMLKVRLGDIGNWGVNFKEEVYINAYLQRYSDIRHFNSGQSFAPTQSESNRQCIQAQQDYDNAAAKYKSAKERRATRRRESAAAGVGALGGGGGGLLMGLLANSADRDAEDLQRDMDHALSLMRDAKRRISIFCGN